MNEQLRQELLAMKEEDQQVLRELVDSGELKGQEYHPRMRAVHDKHNARIKAIIDEHGWPGRSLVGEDGTKAAWLIVQHAVLDTGFMERTLLLLREAVRNGEAEGWCLAYLQDRVLSMAGEPQITEPSMTSTRTGSLVRCRSGSPIKWSSYAGKSVLSRCPRQLSEFRRGIGPWTMIRK